MNPVLHNRCCIKLLQNIKNPRDLYADKLMADGIIDAGYVKVLKRNTKLIRNEPRSFSQERLDNHTFMRNEWLGFGRLLTYKCWKSVDTSYSKVGNTGC
jgi:2-oxoglutarate dehydrogenase E1 component